MKDQSRNLQHILVCFLMLSFSAGVIAQKAINSTETPRQRSLEKGVTKKANTTPQPKYSASPGKYTPRGTSRTSVENHNQKLTSQTSKTETNSKPAHQTDISNEQAILPITPICLNAATTYSNFWQNCNVVNNRKARRQMRNCGCRGDIEYINQTSDTLDFYFAYLTTANTPTLENAVLPSLKNSRTYPAFYLAPGDSATVRGSCTGGLHYEAFTRTNRYTGNASKGSELHINRSVRLSCKPKTLILSEDME